MLCPSRNLSGTYILIPTVETEVKEKKPTKIAENSQIKLAQYPSC
jgi:hypothetical protein